MPLQLGIVGLPNVGKTTLFNALTRAGATVANYPFTTIDPNIGIAPVPDTRLGRVAEIARPQRTVPATMRVVDIAGLVKGASQGEGLGNQFLAHVRETDAIAMVVRCFENEDVPHVTAEIDPVADIDTVQLELIMSDLEALERHTERVKTHAKGHPREFEHELALLERVRQELGAGRAVRQIELGDDERQWLHPVALLTGKPVLYICNCSEEQLPSGGELASRAQARVAWEKAESLVVCAQLEAELAEWDPADAAAYLAQVGLSASGLERVIWAGYRLLNYITFFTATGEKEVRAWALPRGRTVLDAAALIHTDMARGFVRAEVVAYEDLDRAGSFVRARELGRLRLEGREYVVHDGDVIHIRFAV